MVDLATACRNESGCVEIVHDFGEGRYRHVYFRVNGVDGYGDRPFAGEGILDHETGRLLLIGASDLETYRPLTRVVADAAAILGEPGIDVAENLGERRYFVDTEADHSSGSCVDVGDHLSPAGGPAILLYGLLGRGDQPHEDVAQAAAKIAAGFNQTGYHYAPPEDCEGRFDYAACR